MKVKRIALEDRSGEPQGQRVKTIRFDPERLESVNDAIAQLDGSSRSTVVFELEEVACLSVGGGNDGRYVVDVTLGDDETGPSECFALLNDSRPNEESEEDEIEVVTGGQGATYPPSQIVDKKTAIEAATYWCRHGERSPALNWEGSG